MAIAALQFDPRRHRRVAVGRRAMVSDGIAWHDCKIVDISGGGASLDLEFEAPMGTTLVLCDPELGFIAATVVRRTKTRTVICFGIDAAEKAELTDMLTGLLNAHLLT